MGRLRMGEMNERDPQIADPGADRTGETDPSAVIDVHRGLLG